MACTKTGGAQQPSRGAAGAPADHLEILRLSQSLIIHRLGQRSNSIKQVAQAVGLSERTLQRRLNRCGWVFADLVEAVRRSHAETLLKDGVTPLADVALSLGYSEQSAFSRAFKRWTRLTPNAYRKQRLGEGNRNCGRRLDQRWTA